MSRRAKGNKIVRTFRVGNLITHASDLLLGLSRVYFRMPSRRVVGVMLNERLVV